MLQHPGHMIRRLAMETSGAIAIQMVIALPALIGMAALGAEMTTLYVHQKRMQQAADQAVLSAGATGLSDAQRLNAAKAMAATNGFADGVGGVSVTLNTPPKSGLHVSTSGGLEVIISRPYDLHLARLFLPSSITIKARAVSIPGRQSTGCVLALSPTAAGAITVTNQASVSNVNCEVVSNSNSASSLTMLNGTTISGPVYLAGGADLSGSAVVLGTPFVRNGVPLDDPYKAVTIPLPSALGLKCTNQTNSKGEVLAANKSLSPGRFCDGLVTGAKENIVMAPGVYYIEKQLSFNNNSTLTATSGVTVILSSGSSFGIGNGVIWRITAPISGDFSGLAFVSNRRVTGTVTVENGARLIIEGAIYLPSMNITFGTNADTSGAKCTQLIAQTITISTSLRFEADCLASNVKKIGRSQPVLSE